MSHPSRRPILPRSPWTRAQALLLGSVVALLALPAVRVIGADESIPTRKSPETLSLGERTRQLARLGVDRWHADGVRGKGVKVAILDSGFRGYRGHLGKALPGHVLVHSFRRDGDLEARDSQHGILCGEVVHALAPEAELLFANWESDRPDQFLAAVRWAREQGARVISCSVIMPSWSDGEGGGPVHRALARALGSGELSTDVLCFASAGNIAQRHWAGRFRDQGDGYHAWKTDVTANPLSPWGGERVSVELYAQVGADYEVSVIDPDTGAEVGRAATRAEAGRLSAVVRFQPEAGRRYAARVRHVAGTPGFFHLVALSCGMDLATQRGSVAFPADGAEVFGGGAVGDVGGRLSYSSCGPNSKHPKPDFVAPVPFTSLWRSRPFAGTSAAAPQAAALAALWLSRNPQMHAADVRAAFARSARDLGAPGPDCEFGYGLIALPAPAPTTRLLADKQGAAK